MAVLAPVPGRHRRSAVETSEAQGVVAFGSGAAIWESVQHGEDIGIAASVTGAPRNEGKPGLHLGRVVMRGRFAQTVQADRHGRHPDPLCRPISTRNDGAFKLFWQLDRLARINPPLPLSRFRRLNGGVVKRIPEFAIPIEASTA